MVSDFRQKSFRIKHEDTTMFFSSKLHPKELVIPSFRIYYGDNVPSSVPFIWESQPGTPKHALSHQISHYLPPLTPPPSYYSNNNKDKKPTRKNSRSKLFHSLIKKLINPNKPHFSDLSPSSSSSSLSWSSSSHSSFSAPTTPSTNLYRRRGSCSQGGSYSFNEVSGKLSTTACFGHQAGVFMMKKALFSVLNGRRTS